MKYAIRAERDRAASELLRLRIFCIDDVARVLKIPAQTLIAVARTWLAAFGSGGNRASAAFLLGFYYGRKSKGALTEDRHAKN